MLEFSNNLAVVIGINQYGNGISLLKTPINDVRAIAQILEQKHRYQVMQFLDQQATLQALQQLLHEQLPKHIQPDSRLLFYFAGHGIALNGDDGPQGYLIPQDAKLGDVKTYLPMTELQAALSDLPCRHFLGILDCCFAGAFRWSSTRKLELAEQGIVHKERFDRFITDPAWQVITSAAYDQTALDSLTLGTERGQIGDHSPFAAALIEALSAGKADVYPPANPQRNQPAGDGVTTATDLYIYLRDRIEPVTDGIRHRQTPGLWPLKKHDKGEYIFLTLEHELNLPPAPPLDESKNPYRGLQSFEEEQSDLFFGRQALTQELGNFVSRQPLSVVLGASGSGKSSAVSQLNFRVDRREFAACIIDLHLPIHSPLSMIDIA
jgi:Caspase domain